MTDRVSGGFRELGRRVPRTGWVTAFELLLLALLVVQIARLIWSVATPVGTFGDWRGRQAAIPSAVARQALFSTFDPFFRIAATPQGDQVVTSLAITVFGIRVNEGTGLGSAIIATPDGVQTSFAVGDEILPGVVLKAVAFDSITIDRGGAEEKVFLDQSQSAPVADPSVVQSGAPSAAPLPSGAPQGATPPVTAAAIKSDVGFAPRIEGARATGVVLSPKGPMFKAAGLLPGDIVTQVNGRAITSVTDLQALQGQIVPGARLSLMVERGASVVPIAIILQGQ